MSALTHVFSATLAGGGLFAYWKAGSIESLLVAGGSALIFTSLEFLISTDVHKKAGGKLSFGSTARTYSAAQALLALMLCGIMIGRVMNSGKTMPGVPVAALTGVATGLFAFRAIGGR